MLDSSFVPEAIKGSICGVMAPKNRNIVVIGNLCCQDRSHCSVGTKLFLGFRFFLERLGERCFTSVVISGSLSAGGGSSCVVPPVCCTFCATIGDCGTPTSVGCCLSSKCSIFSEGLLTSGSMGFSS